MDYDLFKIKCFNLFKRKKKYIKFKNEQTLLNFIKILENSLEWLQIKIEFTFFRKISKINLQTKIKNLSKKQLKQLNDFYFDYKALITSIQNLKKNGIKELQQLAKLLAIVNNKMDGYYFNEYVVKSKTPRSEASGLEPFTRTPSKLRVTVSSESKEEIEENPCTLLSDKVLKNEDDFSQLEIENSIFKLLNDTNEANFYKVKKFPFCEIKIINNEKLSDTDIRSSGQLSSNCIVFDDKTEILKFIYHVWDKDNYFDSLQIKTLCDL